MWFEQKITFPVLVFLASFSPWFDESVCDRSLRERCGDAVLVRPGFDPSGLFFMYCCIDVFMSLYNQKSLGY